MKNKPEKMKWSKLLNWTLPGQDQPRDIEIARPPWQIDYDRLVFSSAFRRLQDKTQVFPLSGSDYVRTRLTHSLEVSTVSYSLGMMVGAHILKTYENEEVTPKPEAEPNETQKLGDVFSPADFGTIIATAALAHDIGNPPFGHSGEDAVRSWFSNSTIAKEAAKTLKPEQRKDFEAWEGNAQGFRILTRLQLYRDKGGMQLTHAALAAFTKYPLTADAVCATAKKPYKKHGFFLSESEQFETVAQATGLLPQTNGQGWCRHPFAYLMEAADDLCYSIVDFEDGYRLGRIPYKVIEDNLIKVDPSIEKIRLLNEPDDQSRVSYLRARCISVLVRQAAEAFIQNEDRVLRGEAIGDLISLTEAGKIAGALDMIKDLTRKYVYTDTKVLETEAAGFEIIGGLLDIFLDAIETKAKYDVEQAAYKIDKTGAEPKFDSKAKKVLQLIPDEFVGPEGIPSKDPYIRLLRTTDYVTGMTDSYALNLYRRLKGISLSN